MLRCIRCGACMNHCPVYHRIGGHAYGATYPGPMGAGARPGDLRAGEDARAAERLDLLRAMRERLPDDDPAARSDAALAREGVRARRSRRRRSATASACGRFSRARPRLYRLATRIAMRALGNLGRAEGRFASLPLAGGWTKHRDMPAPAGRTFMDLYRARKASARERSRNRAWKGQRARSASPARRPTRKARGRRAARQPAGEPHPGARPARPRGTHRALQGDGGEGVRERRAARLGRRRARRDRRSISATTICRSRSAPAPIRRSRRSTGSASRSSSASPARSDGRDAVSFSHAFAGVAEIGDADAPLRPGEPDHAELPSRHAHRHGRCRRRRRRLRDGLEAHPRALRRRASCRAP